MTFPNVSAKWQPWLVAGVCLLWGGSVLYLLWLSAAHAVNLSEASFKRLMQGPSYAVAQILRETPDEERDEKLAELASEFHWPVALIGRSELHLAPEAMVMLAHGLVTDNYLIDTAYYALDEDTVIKFGPMTFSASDEDVQGDPVFWLTSLVAIAPLPFMGFLGWRRRQAQSKAIGLLANAVSGLATGQPVVLPALDAEWRALGAVIQHQAAEIASLNERHREVSQSVSHELRTPLSRMRFSLALLARCVDTVSRERLQDRLLKDVNELESLVRASLTFSRLAHAPAALALERIDIRDWLEDEIASLETSTSLTIHTHAAELVGDRGLLHLVIRNLLTNAVKYGRTQLSVFVADDLPGRIAIHVDDDGPGILQVDQERVFEPFVRLIQNQSEVQGFGLGLAIVKRAVQWHHGEINIGRSTLGGARFTLTLPLRP